MTPLKGLISGVRVLLDDNFRCGAAPAIAADPFVVELGLNRKIDVDPLIAILDEGMRRFDSQPDSSDAWMAPRVHATLRLSRRDASDKLIWNYLNIVAKPDFVRWRFREKTEEGNSVVPLNRFLGEDSKNAIGRLWWVSELTRNGPDYQETTKVLKTSRFFTSWQALDAMHHRPAAIGVCRFVKEFGDGKGLTDSQSAFLAKVFNLRLATLCLDALAPNSKSDTLAIEEWCAGAVDETKFMGDELPEGPDDEPVSEESVRAVMDVLDGLAKETGLGEFKRTKSKRKAAAAAEAKAEA
jgi:hypothetical protein